MNGNAARPLRPIENVLHHPAAEPAVLGPPGTAKTAEKHPEATKTDPKPPAAAKVAEENLVTEPAVLRRPVTEKAVLRRPVVEKAVLRRPVVEKAVLRPVDGRNAVRRRREPDARPERNPVTALVPSPERNAVPPRKGAPRKPQVARPVRRGISPDAARPKSLPAPDVRSANRRRGRSISEKASSRFLSPNLNRSSRCP